MGHLHVGLEDSYYRPQEEDIQTEYKKGIDALTIDPTKRMARQIQTLEVEKSQVEALSAEIAEIKNALKKT